MAIFNSYAKYQRVKKRQRVSESLLHNDHDHGQSYPSKRVSSSKKLRNKSSWGSQPRARNTTKPIPRSANEAPLKFHISPTSTGPQDNVDLKDQPTGLIPHMDFTRFRFDPPQILKRMASFLMGEPLVFGATINLQKHIFIQNPEMHYSLRVLYQNPQRKSPRNSQKLQGSLSSVSRARAIHLRVQLLALLLQPSTSALQFFKGMPWIGP